MTYWLIQFDDREGFGVLEFNSEMVAIGIYYLDGTPLEGVCEYHPVEFNIEWSR